MFVHQMIPPRKWKDKPGVGKGICKTHNYK